MARPGTCANFNHGKPSAPVRACSMCGEVVNSGIPLKRCDEAKHAKERRERNVFCMDCGTRLASDSRGLAR
jgi:hypothetical protein